MKKEIIKPFDLAKAKAGAKLRTKDGDPVEIFKWDARGIWPIRGMIITKDKDISGSWSSEGKWRYGKSLNGDLVIAEEVETPEFWSDRNNNTFDGFIITTGHSISKVVNVPNIKLHYDVYATKEQAKSALAMARISQIMAYDVKNFGGPITDEEWGNDDKPKYVICRNGYNVFTTTVTYTYYFLAFHTAKQRDLFLEKYPQLVKDYLMIP